MLSYWILRTADGDPIGLVRVENDQVLLTTDAAAPTEYRLFSETDDTPIMPFSAVSFAHAAALLGARNGTLVAYALSPQAKPLSVYRTRLSQIYTTNTVADLSPASEEPQANRKEQPPGAPEEPQADRKEQPPGALKEPQTDPTPAPVPDGSDFSDVSDTARATEAFSRMLNRANAFFTRFEQVHAPVAEQLVQKEDMSMEQDRGIDLLPQFFPGARWRYVEGKNLLGHYEGDYRYPNGESVRILAVRAAYAPRPPRTLTGFTRYVRAPDGVGYWLRFLPME